MRDETNHSASFELERSENDLFDLLKKSPPPEPTVTVAYSPLFFNAAKVNNPRLRVTYKGIQRREKRRLEEHNEKVYEEYARKKKQCTTTRMATPSAIATPPPQTKPWRKNISNTIICRECQIDPPNVVEEFSSGDLVCRDCGLVLGERIIDTRSEWRTFSNDENGNDDPSRVGDGPNALLNGNQLQTDIAFGAGGAAARDLHRAQNKVNQDKGNRALMAAYKDIGDYCDNWQVPKNITDTAKHLYKMTSDAGVFRGKSQEVVIAGCIFIACRQCGAPRTFRETFDLTRVSKKEIGKIFKALETFFKKENQLRKEQKNPDRPVRDDQEYKTSNAANAVALLARYASQLGLDQLARRVAEDVATKMDELGILAGRSPLSQCAASLYFAANLMGQSVTPLEISKALGISDGTIKTVYKVLYQEREKLIDEKWLRPKNRGDMSNLPSI